VDVNLPIAPVVLPSTLSGATNGRLTPDKLTQVGPSGWLERTAARSWRALAAVCTGQGLPLTYTYGGTYRSFEQQLGLFTSRYEECSYLTYKLTPSDRRKIWAEAVSNGYTSTYWRKRLINGSYPASAAAPGHSNHGIGLAVDTAWDRDLADGIGPDDATSITSSPQWPLFQRLVPTFGFSWELQSEPWHIRYVAGDTIPIPTLEFEQGVPPLPPPTPTMEDEMALVAYKFENDPTGAVMLSDGTECWWVPSGAALDMAIWSRNAAKQPILCATFGTPVKGWNDIRPLGFDVACAFGPLKGPVPPGARDAYGRPI
jgi:hypothetical protein